MFQRVVSRLYKSIKYRDQYRAFDELLRVDAKHNRREYQRQKLELLLKAAYDKVPYYRQLLERTSLVAAGSVRLDSLTSFRQLPLLTKEVISAHSEAMHAADADPRRTFVNTSGGSTGEPVLFLQDSHYAARSQASTLLSYCWNGVLPYDKQVIIWGAERDTYKGKKNLTAHVRDYVNNMVVLNTFTLSDGDIERYIDIINRTQPRIMKGYAQSLYEIAEYAMANDISIDIEDCVIHSAATTLLDHMRESIECAFASDVYNYYGSREVGAIASEIHTLPETDLHVLFDNSFIEVVDDDGEPCKAGQCGEIVVTTLNNMSMPLIRYKIGDTGVVGDDGAQCLVLKKVAGRITDMFKTKTGERVYGGYFTRLLYQVDGVRQFQIVQCEIDKIVVKLVAAHPLERVFYDDLRAKICHVMGADTDVVFEIVDEIPKTKTGKFLYTISQVE